MNLRLLALPAFIITACQPPTEEAPPTPPVQAPTAESPSEKPEPKPVTVTPGTITQMELDQFFLMRSEGKLLVVDVRRAIMFSLGHIDGAINLPLGTFNKSFPEKRPQLDAALAAGKVIVLYCDGENCQDGHNAAKALAERGYSTSIYRGGWAEWKAAGME